VVDALALSAAGAPDAAVSGMTGIPVATIRNWRRGRLPRVARLRSEGVALCGTCEQPEHDFEQLPGDSYAQLLGLYLGDGCLARSARSYSLRITMDSRYPGVIAEAAACVRACAPERSVKAIPVRGERCVNVTAYGRAWPCLLPQHGSGKKHLRPIVLCEWQQTIVDRAPGRFVRGLIHSDGWRGENRVRSKGRDYSYPRYQFSSRSDDIRALFTHACDLLGVAWRPWGRWHISVARRDAVALLDEHVGPKC